MSNQIQGATELQDTTLDKSHYRNIRISIKVADRLQSRGKMLDSYNSVIEDLLNQVDGIERIEEERSW